ncbi:ketopantoate reductase [Pseudozyma hubeiensis SY62]|uniref:Ketopantoate reductase n=1 Tax=Pseudozyma hubeiensis (strain SY62) TaxID=1305764 RepID=R9P096_PSEHS|nr:ketopantoate reductase [Pseudozyma hubeiensis SY62]GAC94613.1 ketopantoate reductase [Pseudozyma hubeiensis SY62]
MDVRKKRQRLQYDLKSGSKPAQTPNRSIDGNGWTEHQRNENQLARKQVGRQGGSVSIMRLSHLDSTLFCLLLIRCSTALQRQGGTLMRMSSDTDTSSKPDPDLSDEVNVEQLNLIASSTR